MCQVEFLQMGPYPDWDKNPLNEAFVMHRYFKAADKAAFPADVGTRVRGIATRGELGATAAAIQAAHVTRKGQYPADGATAFQTFAA